MNESDKRNQAATEVAARQALEAAATELAQQHRATLDQARRTALALVKPASKNVWRQGWVGFAVAAGLGAFMLMNTSFQSSTPEAPLVAAEHIVALSDMDTLTEFDTTDYEIIEDLDFAYWLSTQDDNVAPEAAHNG